MHWDLDFQEGKGIDSGTKRGGLKGGRSFLERIQGGGHLWVEKCRARKGHVE